MPATPEQCRRYRAMLRERVKRKIGDSCARCKTTQSIEYAHVHATRLKGPSRGTTHRYIDILRNPSCYVPLCNVCHTAFDAGEFEITVQILLWGHNANVYYPPRRPCD